MTDLLGVSRIFADRPTLTPPDDDRIHPVVSGHEKTPGEPGVCLCAILGSNQ
jgi:hypothetical protein